MRLFNIVTAHMRDAREPPAEDEIATGTLAPEDGIAAATPPPEDESAAAMLAEADEREKDLEEQLADVREQRAEAAARTVLAEDLSERIAGQRERRDTLDDELDDAEAEWSRVRKRGLLSYTLMFGLAAIAFILADVVISRAIVADALSLTGRDFLGLDESWYFACALASIAVLLKPAYDRLVEAPFWEGRRKWFTGTILATSAVAIITLGVLGWFRAVAFEAQTMSQLILEAPGANATERLAALRALQESIVGSGWGKLAFLLSGILFAVGGAICLGISFRHFHDFRQARWPLQRRRGRLGKERKRLVRARSDNEGALREARMDLRRTEIRLGDLPDLERIQEELRTVREEREMLRGQRRKPRPYVAVRRSVREAFEGADLGVRNPDM